MAHHYAHQSSLDPAVMRLLVRGLILAVLCFGGLAALLHYARKGDDKATEVWELGTVLVPPDASNTVATDYLWPHDDGVACHLKYGCSRDWLEALQAEYDKVAKKWLRKKVKEANAPPAVAVVVDLTSEVHRWVLPQSFPYLDALGHHLTGVAREKGWTAKECARIVVGLVQAVDYRIPEDSPFGLALPPISLAQGWGDCDSKTMLAVALLRYFGITATLLSSNLAEHAILAIDLPMPGETAMIRGRKWVLVEATSTWPIGVLAPGTMDRPDWRAKDLRGLWPEGVQP